MLFVIGSIILFMFSLFIIKKALVGDVDLRRDVNCGTFKLSYSMSVGNTTKDSLCLKELICDNEN